MDDGRMDGSPAVRWRLVEDPIDDGLMIDCHVAGGCPGQGLRRRACTGARVGREELVQRIVERSSMILESGR